MISCCHGRSRWTKCRETSRLKVTRRFTNRVEYLSSQNGSMRLLGFAAPGREADAGRPCGRLRPEDSGAGRASGSAMTPKWLRRP